MRFSTRQVTSPPPTAVVLGGLAEHEMNSTVGQTRHYATLDSLRGLCAVMVALFHFRANSHIEDLTLVRNGWLFVDFFFVLSGFVIAESYSQKFADRSVSFSRFIWLRLARIYPLHLVMLALFVVTEFGLSAAYQKMGGAGRIPFTEGRSPALLPENLMLLQSLGISGVPSWNVPAWSISAEFWTYCLFAVALVLGARRVWLLGCLVGAPAAIVLLHGPDLALEFDGGILRCLFGFGLGCAVSWLQLHKTLPSHVISWAELPTVCVVLAFVLWAPGLQVTLLAPVVFGVCVVVFAQDTPPPGTADRRGIVSRLLCVKPMLLLGACSYSIYMVHTYVHARLGNVALLVEKLTGQSYFVHDPRPLFGVTLWAGDIFVLCALLLTLIFSYVTWTYIEKPAQRYLRHSRSPLIKHPEHR